MNRTLESQTAHVHGRMVDDYGLATEQLKMSNALLSKVEARAFAVNNEAQSYRAESSEVSALLQQAVNASTVLPTQVMA